MKLLRDKETFEEKEAKKLQNKLSKQRKRDEEKGKNKVVDAPANIVDEKSEFELWMKL